MLPFFRKQETVPPRHPPFERRMDCLQKLIKIQESLISVEFEYAIVTMHERKEHKNAFTRLERLENQYKDMYKQCEKVLNPS